MSGTVERVRRALGRPWIVPLTLALVMVAVTVYQATRGPAWAVAFDVSMTALNAWVAGVLMERYR